MTERLELYRCNICGNMVQVLLSGAGELVCCGEMMEKVEPKDKDFEGLEKHLPVFEKNEKGENVIKVSSTPHPMVDEHYIMFIETISKDKNDVKLHYLYPGMEPEFVTETDEVCALEYCNIHGLWEAKND